MNRTEKEIQNALGLIITYSGYVTVKYGPGQDKEYVEIYTVNDINLVRAKIRLDNIVNAAQAKSGLDDVVKSVQAKPSKRFILSFIVDESIGETVWSK